MFSTSYCRISTAGVELGQSCADAQRVRPCRPVVSARWRRAPVLDVAAAELAECDAALCALLYRPPALLVAALALLALLAARSGGFGLRVASFLLDSM